jgi:hypothetical protein
MASTEAALGFLTRDQTELSPKVTVKWAVLGTSGGFMPYLLAKELESAP